MMITLADTSDISAIAALYCRSWKTTYRGLLADDFLDAMNEAESAADWQNFLAETGCCIYVAKADASPENAADPSAEAACASLLGFAAVSPDHDDPSLCYLASLHVTKEAQGQGVGTALIQRVFAHAREAGAPALTISIVKGNENARRLYTKLGAEHLFDFEDHFGDCLSHSEKLIFRFES